MSQLMSGGPQQGRVAQNYLRERSPSFAPKGLRKNSLVDDKVRPPGLKPRLIL
jgi:hypothetical protein